MEISRRRLRRCVGLGIVDLGRHPQQSEVGAVASRLILVKRVAVAGRAFTRPVVAALWLHENIGPGDPMLLHEMLDGDVCRFSGLERGYDRLDGVVCHALHSDPRRDAF
jgi:hypothetical protein